MNNTKNAVTLTTKYEETTYEVLAAFSNAVNQVKGLSSQPKITVDRLDGSKRFVATFDSAHDVNLVECEDIIGDGKLPGKINYIKAGL